MFQFLTKTYMDEKFVTAYKTDWPIYNQSALQAYLRAAYDETNNLCDPERSAVFTTPNQHMHTGYTRFIAVSQKLYEACLAGRLPGITAEWREASGNSGFFVLVLRGQFTRLMVCHISHPEESPRDCVTRFDGRVGNQVLMDFEEDALSKKSPLLTLTLVHGHRNAEFAFIRGYNDPARPGSYEQLSSNIMELPTIMPAIEEEDITPPETDIKDHLRPEDEEGEQSS